jgi:phage protein D
MSPTTRATVAFGLDSYVPQIEVKLDGQEFALDDVIELRVTLQKDELGGFSMQLANDFDLKTQQFRHSDFTHLDIFKPVEIRMGYAAPNRMAAMFIGEITALSPSFPSSGLPTLTVTGTDLLGRLRRAKPGADQTKTFKGRRDWEIAQQVAQRNHLGWSKASIQEGPLNPVVSQRDMDDLTFVMWLAKRNDFEAAVVIEDGKEKLYFGKPRDKRGSEPAAQIELTWGESLVSFTPRLSIGRQVSKVTVRGWDPRKKQKIEVTASVDDLKAHGKGDSAARILESKDMPKEERIVDRVVQSEAEAKALALQLLAETANQFLTGSGEAMGEPAIRPQTMVKLGGLGPRYNGAYYVTKADHVYGASGYMTTFDVERMKEGA